MNPKYAYLENQVNSATPMGLVIMLHDGLLKFAGQAIENLNLEGTDARTEAADSISRCIRIVTELNNSLRHDLDAGFSTRLSNLYGFFLNEFSRSLLEHSSKPIEDILPLVEELRDGWIRAEEQLQQEPATTGSFSNIA